MLSNKVALGVLGVLALVGAAGAGAYIATRHATTQAPAAVVPPSTTPAAGGAVEATEAVMDEKPAAAGASGTGQPVQEAQPPQAPEHVDRQPARSRRPASAPTAAQVDRPSARAAARPSRRDPVTAGSPVATSRSVPATTPLPVSAEPPTTMARAERPPVDPVAELPPAPQYLEVTVPSDAVVGLQIETAVSSETARVEDRVVARVTRDVRADGRVAIPAGSKVIGAVSIVERGGRMKDQAKLGVRFHTVILADGTELPLQTETIYRVGEAPGNASAAKVGGGAIGGAILGAILGGGKGAAIGGAIGAAGGTAAVMASDRHPAVLAAGSPITVKVLSPVTVTVEKD